jgi:FkbM family methyltransferase
MEIRALGLLRARFHPLHFLRKSRFVRNRLLPILDRDVAIKGDFARKIYVKAITHCCFYMATDTIEPRSKRLFRALLEKIPDASLFFDIGANVGYYTWVAAGTRKDLKIVAFEPDPENFRLLTKTASAWRSHNVSLRQVAVSDSCGTASFERDIITSATGSLEEEGSFTQRHFDTLGNRIQVLTTTVDAVAAEEGAPAIIKIDVEGHEAKVFAGAWNTVQRCAPIIFFESCYRNSVVLSKLNQFEYILFDSDRGSVPTVRTRNYVAVRSGSALETMVKQHLSVAD